MSETITYNNNTFIKYIENKEIIIKIKKLCDELNKTYKDEKLHIIGLLDGCIPTLNELTKHIIIDYEITTIKVTSYKGMKQGDITFKDIIDEKKIINSNVLIVDDIIDSGNTIKNIKQYILNKSANVNLKTLSLLVKEDGLQLCDWYCFKIPNKSNVLIVEDVITTGKSVLECYDLIKDAKSKLVGYSCIIDRTGNQLSIKEKIISQIKLNIKTYKSNELPDDLKKIKPIKPGSRDSYK